jgi:hypothetical protein
MAISCWSIWVQGGNCIFFCRMWLGGCLRWNSGYTILIIDKKMITSMLWRGGCLSLIYDSIMLYCNWRLTCMPQNQYKLKRCKEIKAIQQDALRGIEPQSINWFCPIAIECYYVLIEPYWWMNFAHKQVKVNLHRIAQNSKLVMSWNQLREKPSP